jgi:signal transduction histidine kinase/ligand-binding sensor domain-containing protein
MADLPARLARLTRAGLLAAAVLAPTAVHAQGRFDSWSIEDGLPQNSVNDILQTRDGYLWLATYGGLVRFDGIRFAVFDRSVAGVESLRIRTLHEDRSGSLWAATDDGMLLRHRAGTIVSFDAEDGYPNAPALHIDEDDRGALWITAAGVVTKFDGRTFETFRPGDLPRGVEPHVADPRGYFPQGTWWTRDADGLHCLLKGVVRACVPPDVLPDQDVVHVAADNHGSVWARFADQSLLVQEGVANRTRHRRQVLAEGSANDMLFRDRAGRLWTYGPSGRIHRWTGSGWDLVAEVHALSLYEDSEGSIWIGSTDGLRRLRTPSIAVRSVEHGLSSNNVYAMLRDRRGDIWVGTWGAGVNRLAGGSVKAYGRAQGLPSDDVTTIFEDATGRLWVGTTLGLSYRSGERFVRYADPEGWLAGHVWTMFEDAAGDLWFGTNRGLVRRRPDRFDRYTTSNGLSHDRVTVLLRDRGGTMWIGTSRGVSRYRDGSFSAIGEADGLVGNDVRALYEDGEGAIWIGTYDAGLYRIKDGRLGRVTTAQGLYDNGVFQILEDRGGSFWMGSNRGLSRVARGELIEAIEGRTARVHPAAFGIRDGLTTLECNGGRQPAGLQLDDGTIWIPTQGGIAVVDPAAVPRNRHPPPVRIEEVRLQGRPVAFEDGINAPADEHVLEVRYTALAFAKPDLVRFRHRLVGLDEEWVDAGASRVVAYYRLPPGRYEFQVTAANSDGVWNAAGDRFAVIVVAPVWRQGWFLACAGVVVAAVAVFLERRRTARLRRQHAQREAFARQLLETQESERRRISNELHDSLGQSLSMIRQRARTDRERAGVDPGPTLDEIAGLAAKAYDEMKTIAYDLRPYQLDKAGLSRTIDGMLRRVSDACGIVIDSEVEDVDAMIRPDARIHVFRIVQESVSNIVKHAGATRARVRLRRHGGVVELEVSDNGRGLNAGIGAEAAAASFGLTSIGERARASSAEVSIRSRPGQGTTVLVRFPIHDPGGPA